MMQINTTQLETNRWMKTGDFRLLIKTSVCADLISSATLKISTYNSIVHIPENTT